MPAPARKAAAKKTPAQAAAAEALGEDDIAVEFRGKTFVITGDTRKSFRFAMAAASGNEHQMIYEMISPADKARFINLGKPGEAFSDVAVEFYEAYGEASGQGNS